MIGIIKTKFSSSTQKIIVVTMVCMIVSLTMVGFASAQTIPEWIKKNASWWANGQISDQEFATGLAYMVKNKIIQVENVDVDPQGDITISEDLEIPEWIKKNARWWVDGAIADGDFKLGIQHMVKNKIISFDGKEKPTQKEKSTQENQSPIAKIDVDSTSVLKNEDILFSATSSYDPDGKIKSYAWDFGDGNTGKRANVFHKYSNPGKYTVTLTVCDSGGLCNSKEQIVEVSGDIYPIAKIKSDLTGSVDKDVTFDGGGSYHPDGEIISYAWDFGDDNTDNGVTVIHQYSKSGRYTVTLTVCDSKGLCDNDAHKIRINRGGGAAVGIGE